MKQDHPLRSKKRPGNRRRATGATRSQGTRPKKIKSSQGILSSLRGALNRLAIFGLSIVLAILAAATLIWFSAPDSPATFLIIGTDQRPGEAGPTRADTILLAHVDPARDFAFLVSIPRDLWLPQPSGLTNRVNTAMFNGYDPNDAHAGPRYLAKTIEDNFGVPTSGYFVVNFAGFVDIIDAAGGITVDVPVLLEDNAYPTENFGTMSVRFEPGRQKMDGERALIYVRTRHQDSDFGRAARQQQVLGALARRLLAPSGWPRIPGVLAATLRAVQTDVSLLQVPALARFAVYVATNRSETAVLGREYTEPWTTETGAAVLLPNWDAIHRLFQQLFP